MSSVIKSSCVKLNISVTYQDEANEEIITSIMNKYNKKNSFIYTPSIFLHDPKKRTEEINHTRINTKG